MRDYGAIEATVADFVRLLKDGGLLVFQLPSNITRSHERAAIVTSQRALRIVPISQSGTAFSRGGSRRSRRAGGRPSPS